MSEHVPPASNAGQNPGGERQADMFVDQPNRTLPLPDLEQGTGPRHEANADSQRSEERPRSSHSDQSARLSEPAGEPQVSLSSEPRADDATQPVRRPWWRLRRKDKKPSFWRELPVLLVIAFVVAVLVKTFVVQFFQIPSGSMETTLHGCDGCSGDRVLVNKFVYDFRDPRPGEIVVFQGDESWAPEFQVDSSDNPVFRFFGWFGEQVGLGQPDEKDFVKRVIAVGGQTISCCDAEGRVVVDGRSLDEEYIYRDSRLPARLQQFGPVEVPEGRLWVMGDNRTASADSRAHINDEHHGTIAVDDVRGKAFVIGWPPSRWAHLGSPPDTFDSMGQQLGATSSGVAGHYAVGLLVVMPFAVRRWRRSKRH